MEYGSAAVRVNTIRPDVLRTAMRARAFPGEDPQSLEPPEAVAGLFVELAETACTRHGEIVSYEG